MEATTNRPENERIARRIPEDVATRGDVDLIEELCSPDVVDHGSMGDLHGIDEVKANIETLRAAFPDFRATVEDVVSAGDTVAMRVVLSGTHEGPFMGVEPTGRSFEVQNAVFTRIEDGRIVERWTLPDSLGMLRQLGVTEIPTG